jgi:hypothetical protein
VREIVNSCYGACVDRYSCEPRSCEYGGENHALGETFPADDGCNDCRCQQDGQVACTIKLCSCDDPRRTYVSRDPEVCTRIDFMCAAGSSQFVDGCGCGCEQT